MQKKAAKDLIKKIAIEKKEREKRLLDQRRLNAEKAVLDIQLVSDTIEEKVKKA